MTPPTVASSKKGGSSGSVWPFTSRPRASSGLARHKFGWHFFFTSVWDPIAEQFGALPFIWGTLYSSLLAILLSTPIALGIAIYISELCPAWLRRPLVFLTELLAAIPSIVYGAFAPLWFADVTASPLLDYNGYWQEIVWEAWQVLLLVWAVVALWQGTVPQRRLVAFGTAYPPHSSAWNCSRQRNK